ncbi:MAG: hypothetical protein Kow009_03810 [Spirochaetales bacterium]
MPGGFAHPEVRPPRGELHEEGKLFQGNVEEAHSGFPIPYTEEMLSEAVGFYHTDPAFCWVRSQGADGKVGNLDLSEE